MKKVVNSTKQIPLIIILLFTYLFNIRSDAQTTSLHPLSPPCYFDSYLEQHKTLIPSFEKNIRNYLTHSSLKSASRKKGSVYTIPVVVHIIHNGGTENISDAQIQSQIDVLNEDFRKKPGTKGDGNGVDTEVEFCLARLTPQGKCTNGIARIKSTLTYHQTYQRTMLKDLSFWDNKKYLNMYVVKTINGSSGIAGYSSYPNGPPNEDGIVVRYNYFGRTGTSSPSQSRTTSHEIGHWFGLYHTFNNGCGTDTCTDGDYVCDTPPAANPNYECIIVNSCHNDFPDVNDQIENYLDYSPDDCKNMFTQGQKERMHATLNTFRTEIWKESNLITTGCDTNYIYVPCGAVADFTCSNRNVCIGNPVLFTNKSLNDCTSYTWYFPGSNTEFSTSVNPTVRYDSTGSYNVTLVAVNAISKDSVTLVDYITVNNSPVGLSLPFFEDFETTVFPPNGITLENPDGGITWELDTAAVPYSGFGSAKINNLINTNYGQTDALVIPGLDLTSYPGASYLTFKWAYARSDANYSDELTVLLSTDCGVTFKQILYKTGTSLTTGPTQTTPYITDSSTVWKSASVNLGTYAGSTNAIIKIVNVTDGGNNLYIDNIKIGSSVTTGDDDTKEDITFMIYPNPSYAKTEVNILSDKINFSSFKIYTVSGDEIYNCAHEINKNSFILELGTGIYIIEVRKGMYKEFKKLVVIR